jgi:hypothetical protein
MERAASDLTHLIERLEVFEERLSIRLNALYAFRDPHFGIANVTVNGELHPLDGDQLKEDVDLVFDVYGRSGLLISSRSRHFRRAQFFGFETFSMVVPETGNDCAVSKIRLYPRVLTTAQTQYWRHYK